MPRKAAALAALHAQIRACRKCLEAGYWVAPGAVVHGAPTAKVMTIGQAPGPTEAVVKRPFNAGSGKRLFEWLGEAGFDEGTFRATQYMTAMTKCYPGQSAGGSIMPSSRKVRSSRFSFPVKARSAARVASSYSPWIAPA